MKYESKEAQIVDFAKASAAVMSLENHSKFLRDEYRSAVRAYFSYSQDSFCRKDVIDALSDPEFQLATGKLYRAMLAAKKELKNAKRRLQTRYISLPAYLKVLKSQEEAA